MKKFWSIGLLVVLLAAVAGYGFFRSTASNLGPAEVVDSFYTWYLDYIGDRSTGAMRNPLVDGAYRTSPYLAPQFILEVDELIAGFDRGGFDPFLQAQDIPDAVKVGQAVVTGRTATVPVTTSFAGHEFTIELEQAASGEWLIAGITRAL